MASAIHLESLQRAAATQATVEVRPGVTHLHASDQVISPESYCYDARGAYHSERLGWATARAYTAFKQALARSDVTHAVIVVGLPGAGKSTYLAQNLQPGVVYFDAVFARRSARSAVINMAKALGKPIEALWLQTPLAECMRRNELRPADRRVPKAALAAADLAVRQHPPSIAEGLAMVRIVR